MQHTTTKKLNDYSTFIFDLDGCIHFGNSVAKGAPEFLRFLRSQHKHVLFLSNNSTHASMSISKKLGTMGVEAPPKDIYLASTLTARFLDEYHKGATICVAGTDDLATEISSRGFIIVTPESNTPADILVLGRDLNFDFVRLKACANRVRNGATFYACNADLTHPSLHGGIEPETGALAAAVSAMCGVEPTTFGKPTAYAYECIMHDFGLNAEECLMVGDNPTTDILGAHQTGMDGCWLMLTGKSETMPEGATHAFVEINDVFEAMQKEYT